MTTQKKLNIGVFGGYRGKAMIKVLFNHPDARLAAVCDKYQPILDKVKAQAEELGTEVACYDNFEDFIKHPELDAVVLANYATEHATFAVRCMKEGKHVLSEVLPCETIAQAVELIETVEATGMVYSYAENYCYMSHSFEMWRRYRTGEIGDVKYAEANYFHDCSGAWPDITYGDRNHWRNRLHPTFYCTHSLGPLMTITGLRPKSVVGFEILPPDSITAVGRRAGAGMEIVTMENGAVFKSTHGPIKREPVLVQHMIYGNTGCMEGTMKTKRIKEDEVFNIYKESETVCSGEWENYEPDPFVAKETWEQSNSKGHGGSDFYPTHCFIEKILGREDGKWSIDVYTAVDMGIVGLLAYRSILAGNVSVDIPNLRNKEERDAWRNDNACTNPDIAGDALLPTTSIPALREPLSDEVYERVRNMWLENEKKKTTNNGAF